jgi:hypothetical protein
MSFCRKYFFLFTALALLAFVSVLVIEGAHHHDNLESHNDCSLCAWQQTGSQAQSTPTPPPLLSMLLLVFFFTSTPFFIPIFKSFPSLGRAPPQNLL